MHEKRLFIYNVLHFQRAFDIIDAMRVYLDVCCLNRPFDDQIQDRVHLEAEAILSILNHIKIAKWTVVGSEAIDYEISKIPDDDKRGMVRMLSTMQGTHVKVDAGVEKRAGELKAAGLKQLDALHIACAEKAKSDVLLTTDDQLLYRATKGNLKLKVKVDNPLRWVMGVL